MINLDARQRPTVPDQEPPLRSQLNRGRGRGGAGDSAASGGDGEERRGERGIAEEKRTTGVFISCPFPFVRLFSPADD